MGGIYYFFCPRHCSTPFTAGVGKHLDWWAAMDSTNLTEGAPTKHEKIDDIQIFYLCTINVIFSCLAGQIKKAQCAAHGPRAIVCSPLADSM